MNRENMRKLSDLRRRCINLGLVNEENGLLKYDELIKAIELKEENEKLKDNWNKLKKYCKENLYFYSGLQNEDLETDTSIQDVLNKMQELEKGDSNE